MAHTSSWSFPNLIDPTRNCVSIVEDNASITNRTRLLLLSDRTSLYHNPNFGAGLRRYIFQYNNANTIARIQDDIKEQLYQFEPCVVSEDTEFADGLLFTGDTADANFNHVKMTVGLKTIYGDRVRIGLEDNEP